MFKNVIKATIIGLISIPLFAGALSTYLPFQGGTGISTIPSYGQVLVGNANGTYTLTATSSLGIQGFSSTLADAWINTYNKGYFFSTTSADYWLGTQATTSSQAAKIIFAGGVQAGQTQDLTPEDQRHTAIYFYTNGTLKNLSIVQSGVTSTTTIYKNGVATSLEIATSSSGESHNITNSVPISSGDYIEIKHNNGGPGTNAIVGNVDFFQSTTVFQLQGFLDFFSTTSADYWDTTKTRWATTSANYFADSSTTIAKLYSSNTWTNTNLFSTLPTLGTLTGLISGNGGALGISATNTISCGTGLSCTAFTAIAGAPISLTSSITQYSNTDANDYIHASSTIPKTYTSNVFTALQSWAYSSSTIMSSFQNASTTKLSQGGHNIYSIRTIYNSIPLATTTDETVKFGTCLRQGGAAFTITSIDTLIASTSGNPTYTSSGMGFAWNINIANNTNTTTPMTGFTAAQYSVGTTSIQSFVPNSVATIPAGYCAWIVPTVASTTQVQMFYWNINGYDN